MGKSKGSLPSLFVTSWFLITKSSLKCSTHTRVVLVTFKLALGIFFSHRERRSFCLGNENIGM
jgi:hypothetical protein